jgi:hypothetical protein
MSELDTDKNALICVIEGIWGNKQRITYCFKENGNSSVSKFTNFYDILFFFC